MLDNDQIHSNMEIEHVRNELNMLNMSQHRNYETSEYNQTLVAPIWKKLSLQLQKLTDPARNNQKYNPLKIDEYYWKHCSSLVTKCNDDNTTSWSSINHHNPCQATLEDVLLELYLITMKFKSMKQILMESNPTLNALHINDKNKNARTYVHSSSMKPVSPKLYPVSIMDPSETHQHTLHRWHCHQPHPLRHQLNPFRTHNLIL